MEMNIKRTFSITLVCIILTSIFCAVVYAPPPADTVTPFQQIIVANDGDNPIPVQVTDATLDVSGWKHTTERGNVFEGSVTDIFEPIIEIETTGFRQLTIKYYVFGDDCEFTLYRTLNTADDAEYSMGTIKETVSWDSTVTITYDVISDWVEIYVTPENGGPANVYVTYYLTT